MMRRLERHHKRGSAVNQTRSDEPGKITAHDAPPILLLVVQDKRLHDEGCRVVLEHGIPALTDWKRA